MMFIICLPVCWSDDAVDRLSVPGPINFDGTSYQLTWSSHPYAYYYKQEYLPAGQTSEHFQRMVLLEAIVQGTDVSGAVSAQINMLNRRKPSDPTVHLATYNITWSRCAILSRNVDGCTEVE
jgi:hypothetical protein